MGTVLLSLLATCLTAGVIATLGEGGAYEKYLQYVCALLLCLVLLIPLSRLTKEEFWDPDLFFDGASSEVEKVPQAYLKQFEVEIERAVSALLKDEFALAEDACRPIATAVDEKGMPTLCRLEIRLYTLKGAALTGKIKHTLEEACGVEVVIVEDVRI